LRFGATLAISRAALIAFAVLFVNGCPTFNAAPCADPAHRNETLRSKKDPQIL
jgi:hypothetical protein